MLRIGLTGGIASGKSTVARLFAAHGAGIVDTDEIAREIVVPGSPALAEIVERFGSAILLADGTLDRRRLREAVFADAGRRRQLEAILHPRIRAASLAAARACRAPYVMLVVPLLFETGFDRHVDRTLVVDCPEETQLERLLARDNMRRDTALAMIHAQLDRAERIRLADDLLDNAGSEADLKAAVARLHETYLGLARNCSSSPRPAE